MLSVTFPLVENGRVKMLLAYVTDISHQKWAEAVQVNTAVAAVEAKRQQESFLDVTSHELRNPLSAITQLADDIIKSLDSQVGDRSVVWRDIARDNAEAANIILTCAAHQKRIIDDVLILSRLDSQLLSITPVVARPYKVVVDAIKMFDRVAALNQVEIAISSSADQHEAKDVGSIFVDVTRLTQILINLINNAIKFTASQSIRAISVGFGVQVQKPVRLETRYGHLNWVPARPREQFASDSLALHDSEERMYVYFTVQDTGQGLTSEEIERLFKRFSQASSKTNFTHGGSGLGLYICRELVEKQGGAVGVASKPGQGSVFAFYLETRACGQTKDQPLHKESVPTALPNTSTVPGFEPFSVLLVEDNPVNQKILMKQLWKAKCTVVAANNGEEALNVIEQSDCWQADRGYDDQNCNKPDSIPIEVVLMDIEMPVMDGLTCMEHIRRLEKEGKLKRRLPIIATTANVRPEQRDKALTAGVDALLAKPFTVGDAIELIRKLVR